MDTSEKIALGSAIFAGLSFVGTCIIGWLTWKKSDESNRIANEANAIAQRSHDRQFLPDIVVGHGIDHNVFQSAQMWQRIQATNQGSVSVTLKWAGIFTPRDDFDESSVKAVQRHYSSMGMGGIVQFNSEPQGVAAYFAPRVPEMWDQPRPDSLPAVLEPQRSIIQYFDPVTLIDHLARERSQGATRVHFAFVDGTDRCFLSPPIETDALLADLGVAAHHNQQFQGDV